MILFPHRLSRAKLFRGSPPARRTAATLVEKTIKTSSIASLIGLEGAGSWKNAEIEVTGFVQAVRKQSKVVFAAIKDGSTTTMLQAVLRPEHGKELSVGAAVVLRGTWVPCPEGSKQPFELRVAEAKIAGDNDPEANPLQNKYQSPQFLRTIPHLRARIAWNSVLMRIRSSIIHRATAWFSERGFVQIHTPLITSSDCEGAGEVFAVSPASDPSPSLKNTAEADHYFKSSKYLTVSAQLHLEAMAQAMEKVWTLSPTFRAEKSDTSRHLSEFYMLEAEQAFIEDLTPLMSLVEGLLKRVTHQCILSKDSVRQTLLERAAAAAESGDANSDNIDPEKLQARWDGIMLVEKWPRISYKQAISILEESAKGGVEFEHRPSYQDGLQAEHERHLAEKVGQGSPVFVTDYPREQKPFYMLPSPGSDGRTVACFDLLVPDLCEIAGGSLREHRLEPLMGAMKDKGLLKSAPDAENGTENGAENGDEVKETEKEGSKLDWYLDLRRYGSVPHGGFGLGFDRLLCYLTGVSNVRDTAAFPRWYGRCDT